MNFQIVARSFPYLVLAFLIWGCNSEGAIYKCPPCDRQCDVLEFKTKGRCPHCNMVLVNAHALVNNVPDKEIKIAQGSGSFKIPGGPGKEHHIITVFYHRPKTFSKNSKILVVIPGSGRNGDSYRDAWIPEAEAQGILILSPKYPEENYLFEDYHLCGMVDKMELNDNLEFVKGTNQVKLREEDLGQNAVDTDSSNWIFQDFDRIFDLAVKATGLERKRYDIFGHSAGGQILHRLALFGESERVNRIFAANSGFFTTIDTKTFFPFGLKNSPLESTDLKKAFAKQLIIVVGQLDNENEKKGILLRSPTVDEQGTNRLARATHFYTQAKVLAQKESLPFQWKLEIIPNVGHDHRAIGDAILPMILE